MRDQVYVSFPGLSDNQFVLNKVAFKLFGTVEVYWYGIFITLGILLAFAYATWRGKRNEGIIADDVLDVGLLTVILGVIGARLYYVLSELERFPTLRSVFDLRSGGLGIYGGIIGGCLGIVIACKVKKISWIKLFDMAAPGVMIAQAVGRWGNFFNGEAYGYPITADGTRYFFFLEEFRPASGEGTFFNWIRMGLYPNEYASGGMVFVHPTFLYESVWNVLGFILINLFYKRKKFDGQIALMYFAWYGFGRMLIEGFRSDSLYVLKGVVSDTGLRLSQCVGLICFVGGLLLLFVFGYLRREKRLAPEGVSAEDLAETSEEMEDGMEDTENLDDVKAIYGDDEDEIKPDELEATEETEAAEEIQDDEEIEEIEKNEEE